MSLQMSVECSSLKEITNTFLVEDRKTEQFEIFTESALTATLGAKAGCSMIYNVGFIMGRE